MFLKTFFILNLDAVRNAFESAGIYTSDDRAFAPHLTLAKLSKDFKLSKKLKTIKPSVYKEFADLEFGAETVER